MKGQCVSAACGVEDRVSRGDVGHGDDVGYEELGGIVIDEPVRRDPRRGGWRLRCQVEQ